MESPVRPVTGLAALAVVVLLLGVSVLGLLPAGGDIAVSLHWISDTGRDALGNHHAVAVGHPNGTAMVYAPVSGGTTGCALIALRGDAGTIEWDYDVPRRNCTIHAVADPAVADYDADGVAEVLAATTEHAVHGFDPADGAMEFTQPLSSYGYTAPVVASLSAGRSIVTVDVRGRVFVRGPDGRLAWTNELGGLIWADPRAVDVDADGEMEVIVGQGNGSVTALSAAGDVEWRTTIPDGKPVGWVTVGQGDGDVALEVYAASTRGHVVAIDGATGDRSWVRQFADYAAVRALGDGDDDGQPELYAVADDGILRTLDAATGRLEWERTLAVEPVQMMPPPVRGDVDGDGDWELVAVTNNGLVTVVDPAEGAVLATYEREVPVYTHPTLGDLDGDGDLEILTMYADGRVLALDVDHRGWL